MALMEKLLALSIVAAAVGYLLGGVMLPGLRRGKNSACARGGCACKGRISANQK